MKRLAQVATAGFEERNDVLITVEPIASGIEVALKSNVARQYGEHITALIEELVKAQGFDGVKVTAVDRGAWDYTIKARVIGALGRGMAE